MGSIEKTIELFLAFLVVAIVDVFKK